MTAASSASWVTTSPPSARPMLSLPILKRTEEDEEGIERLSASTRLPSYSKDCRCSLLLQGCETLELLWRPLPQDKGGGSRESSWASATVAGRFVKNWEPSSQKSPTWSITTLCLTLDLIEV